MPLIPLKKVMDDDSPAAEDIPPSQGEEAAEQAPAQAGDAAPPEQPPAGEAPAQGADAASGPVTAEEQKAYDAFVTAAGALMYQDDATHSRIMKQLELEKDNPAPAIAMIATSICVEIDKQSGGTTPERVIIPASVEVSEHVAELGQSAGLFTADDVLMGKVGQALLAKMGDAFDISKEEIQQFLDQFTPDEKEQARAQQDQIANGGGQGAPAGQPQPGGVVPPQGVPA